MSSMVATNYCPASYGIYTVFQIDNTTREMRTSLSSLQRTTDDNAGMISGSFWFTTHCMGGYGARVADVKRFLVPRSCHPVLLRPHVIRPSSSTSGFFWLSLPCNCVVVPKIALVSPKTVALGESEPC